MAKTCALCGYATDDEARFPEHMQTAHGWTEPPPWRGPDGPRGLDNLLFILLLGFFVVCFVGSSSFGFTHGANENPMQTLGLSLLAFLTFVLMVLVFAMHPVERLRRRTRR